MSTDEIIIVITLYILHRIIRYKQKQNVESKKLVLYSISSGLGVLIILGYYLYKAFLNI
jgi:multisubunit Na+/H+ antiporter MnhB subunit|tara:strand:+ start:908 stop:1084 length:177 start_codon:yes stop_codon:yes gene_type:complete